MFSSKNLPIMPTLCSKLAYYAGIMLDALACLLCLKLCRHNRRMPSMCVYCPTLQRPSTNVKLLNFMLCVYACVNMCMYEPMHDDA